MKKVPYTPRDRKPEKSSASNDMVKADCGHMSPRKYNVVQINNDGTRHVMSCDASRVNEVPVLCPDCAKKFGNQMHITDDMVVPLEKSSLMHVRDTTISEN